MNDVTGLQDDVDGTRAASSIPTMQDETTRPFARAEAVGDRTGPRWEWPPIENVARDLEHVTSTAMVDRTAMFGAAPTLARLLDQLERKLGAFLPEGDESRSCRNKLSRVAASLSLIGDRSIPQDANVAFEVADAANVARLALTRIADTIAGSEDASVLQPARIAVQRALGRLAEFDTSLLPPRLARGTIQPR